MQGNILEKWEHSATRDTSMLVIPDGCRDLLFCAKTGQRPKWRITTLDHAAYLVDSKAGDTLMGYRLRPGVLVDVPRLLRAVEAHGGYGDIASRINDFTQVSTDVCEALECISQSETVALAAARLGINARRLQRICSTTGRTPAAWLSLARARKAARAVCLHGLVETAYNTGYSDQAHMSREFKRWFGVSPLKLRKSPDIIAQLDSPGYF